MVIFYEPIHYNGELVNNYSTESKYYLSGWECLLCWDSKFYHASSDVGKSSANFGILHRASPTMHELGGVTCSRKSQAVKRHKSLADGSFYVRMSGGG